MATRQRKIIHIDLDCFYAAVELRERPELRDKPVAIGGHAQRRGVICTCNYVARQYGVRAAMATAYALERCPDLILLPANFSQYRAVSENIQQIFWQYTDLVEPLSLDEAYLDVTDSRLFHGSATLLAQHIRQTIWQQEQLTASAGIASNKLLAKIASDWHKPNGQKVIIPQAVNQFMQTLPVEKLFGVGPKTRQKLQTQGIYTCGDLQQLDLAKLLQLCGSFGATLYDYCRGIDKRPVNTERERKSLSVETTFSKDLRSLDALQKALEALFQQFQQRRQRYSHYPIQKCFIKLKYNDFSTKTAECTESVPDYTIFENLLQSSLTQTTKPLRLLGLGVRFAHHDDERKQLSLFPTKG